MEQASPWILDRRFRGCTWNGEEGGGVQDSFDRCVQGEDCFEEMTVICNMVGRNLQGRTGASHGKRISYKEEQSCARFLPSIKAGVSHWDDVCRSFGTSDAEETQEGAKVFPASCPSPLWLDFVHLRAAFVDPNVRPTSCRWSSGV